MIHTIGKLHRPSGTVELTVRHGDMTVTRPVNACFAPDGSHDRKATHARAAAVARGVARKIECGTYSRS